MNTKSDLQKLQSSTILPFSDLTETLEQSWVELVEKRNLNPTMHPGWINAALAGGGVQLEKIKVFAHLEGDCLTGILPHSNEVRRKFGIPFRILFLSDFVSYHSEIVCKEDINTFLHMFLSNSPKWDIMTFSNVIDDGPTARAIRQLCGQEGWRFLETPVDVSPYVPLDGTLQELLASRNRKFRYKFRKRNEMLAGSKELRMVWYDEVEQTVDFLKAFVEVEANSWKADSGVEVSLSNREGRYYEKLLPFLVKNKALLANVLWRKDQPIAYSLCCHWGNWIGQLKTGFDNRFKELSPGAMVIDGCLEAAYSTGAKEFDFLGTPGQMDPDPHKLHWTKQTRRHVRFEVFSNRLRSKIFGFLKKRRKPV